MATLVLTAVGTVLGGPIVGIAAAALGFGAGQLFGGSSGSRHGARLSDLAVQSSAYGTPLPRLYGTIRASGSVIWATDIRESASHSGGGKGKPKTTSYSYAASFAVALSARPVRSIKRIWGDGKLMRSSDGKWIIPAVMRLYRGEGDDMPDPLIASAEGVGAAPAYRGMAYAVFEDLDLSEFANHIPSLSFEIEADDGSVSIATIIDDLSGATGFADTVASEHGTQFHGYGMASGGSVRSIFETLSLIDPLILQDDGQRLGFSLEPLPEAIDLDEDDLGSTSAGAGASHAGRMRIERSAADQAAAMLSIGYYDVGRDYQTGLQRAHFGHGARTEQIELPAALAPEEAKALAERRMIALSARTATAVIQLPYRAMAIRPGDILRRASDGSQWRVNEMTVERFVVELGLERVTHLPLSRVSAADGGRSATQNSQPNGDTVLQILDLPPLYDDLPTAPLVWLAATGDHSGWRKAEVSLSLDEGASWRSVSTVSGGSVIGQAVNVLDEAGSTLWDDHNAVEVELIHDGMWIEGRSDDALLAGGNLALIDDELIQFGRAEALGERRFRLSHLLRGRRGTEWASGAHESGGRFVLIEGALAGLVELPLSRMNGHILFKAVGPGQDPGAVDPVSLSLRGAALLPPSPVHLEAVRQPDGDIHIRWIRRSRQGWGWVDGADSPLGEEREVYQLELSFDGGVTRSVELNEPEFTYALFDQMADGGPASVLNVAVSQASATVGPGVTASRQFSL